MKHVSQTVTQSQINRYPYGQELLYVYVPKAKEGLKLVAPQLSIDNLKAHAGMDKLSD